MTPPVEAHLRIVRDDEVPLPEPPDDPYPPPRRPPAAKPAPVAVRTSWTAADLVATHFPEPRWAVPGVIAEGVTLLAGPPKVGKSWLTLALALQIAAGHRALGAIDVQPGPVLYLALEDTARRLKSRITQLLAGQRAPAALTLETAFPTLADGGDRQIDEWLTGHPTARMVVVDVLAQMRGSVGHSTSEYAADYAAVRPFKAVADAHGVAVVLLHHVRKAEAEDFLARVSGSYGLTGAADTTLVLDRARGQADGVLQITGRDVDEVERALAFDRATGHWRLLDGPALEHTLHPTRATILRHLRTAEPSGPTAIADATALDVETVKKTCQRMAHDGQLITDAHGRYTPLSPAAVPPVPAVPEPL